MTARERLCLLSGGSTFKNKIISGGFTPESASYPDFSLTATADEGLIRRTLADSSYTYYFRGAATKNYASIGHTSDSSALNWRIVGITPAGNVRMILAGDIGSSMYGSAAASGAMNYYYYRSAAKTLINQWFQTTDLGALFASDILADDIFYNDVEEYLRNDDRTDYMPLYRLWRSYGNFAPSTVSRDEDRVSVSLGRTRIPAALLTADEAAMAGLSQGIDNPSCYLGTARSWTMSAAMYLWGGNATAAAFGLTLTRHTQTMELCIRPVINVRGEAAICGEGTASSPYTLR